MSSIVQSAVDGGELETRPRKLYRYKPVPPFAVDKDGYPCEDSMSQDSDHIAVFGYGLALKRHLKGRRRAFGPVHALFGRRPRGGDRAGPVRGVPRRGAFLPALVQAVGGRAARFRAGSAVEEDLAQGRGNQEGHLRISRRAGVLALRPAGSLAGYPARRLPPEQRRCLRTHRAGRARALRERSAGTGPPPSGRRTALLRPQDRRAYVRTLDEEAEAAAKAQSEAAQARQDAAEAERRAAEAERELAALRAKLAAREPPP